MTKLLVLAIMIAAVWYGFRFWNAAKAARLEAQRRRELREREAERGVVELERNPRTGAYEPRRRPDRDG